MITTFDTHRFVRRLKEAGIPEAQAEAIAEALQEAQGEADIAALQRDIKELEPRLTIKLGAMLVVAIGVFATLVKLL